MLDPINELVPLLSAFYIDFKAHKAAELDALPQQEKPPSPLHGLDIDAYNERSTQLITTEPPPLDPAKGKSNAPKCRPYWEPPMLGYSRFEDIVKAEKEVNAREGSKDIAWRTEVMDVMIEEDLLEEYIKTIDESDGSRPAGMYDDWDFNARLIFDLRHEKVVEQEKRKITKRHGKTKRDCWDVYGEVCKLAKEARPDGPETHDWRIGFPSIYI